MSDKLTTAKEKLLTTLRKGRKKVTDAGITLSEDAGFEEVIDKLGVTIETTVDCEHELSTLDVYRDGVYVAEGNTVWNNVYVSVDRYYDGIICTSNGTYDPGDYGCEAFNSVIVDVHTPLVSLDVFNVNNDLYIDDGYLTLFNDYKIEGLLGVVAYRDCNTLKLPTYGEVEGNNISITSYLSNLRTTTITLYSWAASPTEGNGPTKITGRYNSSTYEYIFDRAIPASNYCIIHFG